MTLSRYDGKHSTGEVYYPREFWAHVTSREDREALRRDLPAPKQKAPALWMDTDRDDAPEGWMRRFERRNPRLAFTLGWAAVIAFGLLFGYAGLMWWTS